MLKVILYVLSVLTIGLTQEVSKEVSKDVYIPKGVVASYACTGNDSTDYYSNEKFKFPSWWFRVSNHGSCKYVCEPYKTYGDYKVGFSVT